MGILANNLADLSSTPYPGSSSSKDDERSVKHKCRYCGKVFGSIQPCQYTLDHILERDHTNAIFVVTGSLLRVT